MKDLTPTSIPKGSYGKVSNAFLHRVVQHVLLYGVSEQDHKTLDEVLVEIRRRAREKGPTSQ